MAFWQTSAGNPDGLSGTQEVNLGVDFVELRRAFLDLPAKRRGSNAAAAFNPHHRRHHYLASLDSEG